MSGMARTRIAACLLGIAPASQFGDDLTWGARPRQHRDDGTERPLQFTVLLTIDSAGCSRDILNRSTGQGRTTSDVESLISTVVEDWLHHRQSSRVRVPVPPWQNSFWPNAASATAGQ